MFYISLPCSMLPYSFAIFHSSLFFPLLFVSLPPLFSFFDGVRLAKILPPGVILASLTTLFTAFKILFGTPAATTPPSPTSSRLPPAGSITGALSIPPTPAGERTNCHSFRHSFDFLSRSTPPPHHWQASPEVDQDRVCFTTTCSR